MKSNSLLHEQRAMGKKLTEEIQPSEVAIYLARQAGTIAKQEKPFTVIDLFCGAGGMSLGFTGFGHVFEPIWANDWNKDAVATYNRNFGNHCTNYDLVALLESNEFRIPQADVVIGGPPCQGFSLLNKHRDNDPRKQLWRPYLEVVKRSGAKIFVMENVPQIIGSRELDEIELEAARLGFNTTKRKVVAADYGVPQLRSRAIVVGCKGIDPEGEFPPKKTHYGPRQKGVGLQRMLFSEYVANAAPWRTLRHAIADLPAPVGVEINPSAGACMSLHFGRTPSAKSLARYRAIPEEGMNRLDLLRNAPELTPQCWIRKKSGGTDLFGRLWWDRPSVTIRTEFFKPEKGRYLHPSEHRPITHREAARLQGFPDDFEFCGSKIEIARQIGNAVPPPLAARIADSVYALLCSAELDGQ